MDSIQSIKSFDNVPLPKSFVTQDDRNTSILQNLEDIGLKLQKD